VPYRRRSPRPLEMPSFGVPADGRQCLRCKQWFRSSHFWREGRKAFVTQCADCIAARLPNTGNTGRKRPEVQRRNPYGSNDLASILTRGLRDRG
jgi:hypothetical protein